MDWSNTSWKIVRIGLKVNYVSERSPRLIKPGCQVWQHCRTSSGHKIVWGFIKRPLQKATTGVTIHKLIFLYILIICINSVECKHQHCFQTHSNWYQTKLVVIRFFNSVTTCFFQELTHWNHLRVDVTDHPRHISRRLHCPMVPWWSVWDPPEA